MNGKYHQSEVLLENFFPFILKGQICYNIWMVVEKTAFYEVNIENDR